MSSAASPSAGELGPAPKSSARGLLAWLALSVLAVAMLAFAAAHLQGRAGVVFRFAVVFGLIAGAMLGALIGPLAGEAGRTASRRRSLIAGLLIAGGFVGLTLESYRLHVERLTERYRHDPTLALVQQLPPEQAQKIAAEMRQAREKALAADSRFGVYLRYRLSGERPPSEPWSRPWPAVIWGIEILLAGLTAAVAHHLFSRPAMSSGGAER